MRSRRRPTTPDARICSFPKTGRTWLRFQLASYVVDVLGIDLVVDLETLFRVVPNDSDDPVRGIPAFGLAGVAPLVVATHRPRPEPGGGRVVWITRDVMDVLVSYHRHRSRQTERTTRDLGAFIAEEGIPELARYVDAWETALGGSLVITYEAMHADPVATLRSVVTYLGLPVRAGALERAVAAATFERMAAAEARTPVAGHAYDYSDPDARRVRKGEVGGHREVLARHEVAAAAAQLRAALAPRSWDLLEAYGSLASVLAASDPD